MHASPQAIDFAPLSPLPSWERGWGRGGNSRKVKYIPLSLALSRKGRGNFVHMLAGQGQAAFLLTLAALAAALKVAWLAALMLASAISIRCEAVTFSRS